MSLSIMDEETQSYQSLASDVISVGSAVADMPTHGINGVPSDCAWGVMAWAFHGKILDCGEAVEPRLDAQKRPSRISEHFGSMNPEPEQPNCLPRIAEHLGPIAAELERRHRTLLAAASSSDCIPEGLLDLPAERNLAIELLSPKSKKRRQKGLEVSCFSVVSQKLRKVATYIGQVVSCLAVRSDSGVGTGQVMFHDSDRGVDIAGQLLLDGPRALSEMSQFFMNPKGRSRTRSKIYACKKRAKEVKTSVRAFGDAPVTQTLAYTLPAPQQRAFLSPAVKGEPRMEPERLERIVKAQSHKEAYQQMVVRRSDALKESRHLQMSSLLGATPFLLVVPACATCEATRKALFFLMCIHLFFALLLILIAKLCGAKDT